MLSIPPPESTGERQRRFQERHPGYDRRRKARDRAIEKRASERFPALWAEITARVAATSQATRTVLMLPAPVENPVMPGLNAPAVPLAAARAAQPQRD
jgi:hypothetical protein